MEQTKISNKNQNYIAMDYLVVSFTSNIPIMTCMGTQMPLPKLMIKVKVSTPPRDIHRSKLDDIIAIGTKFDKTVMASHISPQKTIKMEKPHNNIGVELTFEAECSHN
jgi:hypothetical protein